MTYPKCPKCGAFAPFRAGVGAFVCRLHNPSEVISLKQACEREPEKTEGFIREVENA